MDQVKIGKFISEKRKEKNITQSELAEKLNITNKSVSNWENGKNMPDVSIMKELCSILDISLSELFNGEQTSSDDGLIKYLKEEKNKKRKKLIISSVLILTILLISTLLIFFINNYNKVNAYVLSGVSDNFEYHDDLLIISNIKNINSSGRLDIKNNNIKDTDIKCVSLKYKDRNISEYCGNNLGGLAYEENGYDEYFSNEVKKNLDELYIEVKYIQDDVEKKEKIKLDVKRILTNNSFFYKKAEAISNGEDSSINYKEREEYLEKVKEELLTNRGFKDDNVLDMHGNPKKGIMLNKTVKDKYIKYHISSGLIEVVGKNRERVYKSIMNQFLTYSDGEGKSYTYDILKNQVIRCNEKKCSTLDSKVKSIIQEYISLIINEFDGLMKSIPNIRYGEDEEDN